MSEMKNEQSQSISFDAIKIGLASLRKSGNGQGAR